MRRPSLQIPKATQRFPPRTVTSSRPSPFRFLTTKPGISPQPHFPVIPSCPAPTCQCSPTPPDLDIDHKSIITNNIPVYDSHILIATGQDDWPSRIEDAATSSSEDHRSVPWPRLISHVKEAFGRKGILHGDSRNTLVTASSLPTRAGGGVVWHIPSWRSYHLPDSARSSRSTISNADEMDPDLFDLLTHLSTGTAPSASTHPPSIASFPITSPVILICTHNSRDSRCGVLGPLLVDTFRDVATKLWRDRNEPVPPSPQPGTATGDVGHYPDSSGALVVAGISHVGGHKWAGNVVIYMPPAPPAPDVTALSGDITTTTDNDSRETYNPDQGSNTLAGHAIWYGRVEPRHVEGILRETIFGGRVIRDLARGVVDFTGVGDGGEGNGNGRARMIYI